MPIFKQKSNDIPANIINFDDDLYDINLNNQIDTNNLDLEKIQN